MALLNDEAKAELPEEVIAEVEGIESGDKAEEKDDAPVTLRVSRRKKEQEEREARLAALEKRAEDAENARREEAARYQAELARVSGAMEQFARQRQEIPAAREEQEKDAGSLDDRIRKQMKKASEALAKQDIDAYHERLLRVTQLQAEKLVASQPRPQQAAPGPQKPDWVRAVEYQYPDVMTHAMGQRAAAAFEALIPGDFGPEKLHRMFQKARAELGIAPAQQAPAATRARQELHTGISSTGTGRPAAGKETKVTLPKDYLRTAMRAGMTQAEAAKAWIESYGGDSE